MSKVLDLIPTEATLFTERVAIEREYTLNGKDIRVLITQVCPKDIEEVVDYVC